MGFTANSNLQSDPQILLKDYRHAANLFAVDQFRLAPKQKFLFHVAFGINTAAVPNAQLVQRYGQEINMLVKNIELPNFQIQTDTLNQYNRKKVVQYQQQYQEIAVNFHDDNMGLINQLWQAYYSYYYADPKSTTVAGAFSRNATKKSNYIPTSYGYDNNSTAPFFNYIKIYQMARHEYVLYQLVNPMITSWNHNKLDYSATGTHDFSMRLKYEAVAYNVGAVTDGDPEGFGLTHYDHTPSPLKGINPDPSVVDPSFVQSLDIEGNAGSFLASVLNQVASQQNSTAVATGGGGGSSVAGDIAAGLGIATVAAGILPGAIGAVGNIAGAVGGAISGAIGGLSDISFPSLPSIGDIFGGGDTTASSSGIVSDATTAVSSIAGGDGTWSA
jgi:hypothetical protein